MARRFFTRIGVQESLSYSVTNADAWDDQMVFIAANGFRAAARSAAGNCSMGS
jgi:hypothetical protein